MEIKITFPGGKKVNAEFDGYVVATDQPVKSGGEGTAPSPFLYFLSSIGTCAGFYVLSFCQERKIPTEGISLNQRVEYIATLDGKSKMDKIVIEIVLPPEFPEKYHEAIIRVADQCTVKKAILGPPKFEIKTVLR